MSEGESNGRDELIERYQRFVHQVAGSLVNSFGLPRALFDEYVSAGYLGLVEAAERFNPQAGSDFKSFAFLRIRGAIIDNVRRSSNVPGYVYSRYVKAWRAANDIRQQMHEKPVPQEPREKLAEAMEFLAQSAMAFRVCEDEAVAELAASEDGRTNPSCRIEECQERELLRALIARLPGKERRVIEEYYFHDKNFVDIAREDGGLSKSWVSRLHARALQRLREGYNEANR